MKVMVTGGAGYVVGSLLGVLVLGLIKQLARQGIAVLVISHNLTDVFQVADRIAVLYLGRLVTEGPKSDFTTDSAVHWITTGSGPGSSGPAPQTTEA